MQFTVLFEDRDFKKEALEKIERQAKLLSKNSVNSLNSPEDKSLLLRCAEYLHFFAIPSSGRLWYRKD